MFNNWEWEDTWHVLGIAAVTALAIFLLAVAFAAKNVDYYYLSTGSSSEPGICVYSHWTWHTDEKAFCSDDRERSLDFVTKANLTLKGKP